MGLGRKILGESSKNLRKDVKDLLADPLGRLSKGDLCIRSFPTLGLWLFGLIGTGILVGMGLFGVSPLIIGVLAVGPAVMLAFWLVKTWSRREILLKKDGVEFHSGRTVVDCPWSMFSALGAPHDAITFQLIAMTLPINPTAVSLVQLFHDETPLTTGYDVKTAHFHFPSANQVQIFNGTELETNRLALLLLTVGRTLGPQQIPESVSLGRQTLESEPNSGSDQGWVTVDVTKLVFPSGCCGCGAVNTRMLDLNARSLRGLLLMMLSLGHYHEIWLNLSVPICRRCNALRIFLSVLGYSSFAAILIGLLSLAIFGDNDWNKIPLVAFFVLLFTGLPLASLLVNYFASPVQIVWHNSKKCACICKFRWSEYARLVRQIQSGSTVVNESKPLTESSDE
jgi:hypothetical protein